MYVQRIIQLLGAITHEDKYENNCDLLIEIRRSFPKRMQRYEDARAQILCCVLKPTMFSS